MARLHLFEFEDQPWCPAVLRNAVTGYLQIVVTMTQQVRPVVAAVADLLRRSGETRILDLCSGSGHIALQVARGLAMQGTAPPMTLTDLYPDTGAMAVAARESAGLIDARPGSLDATEVPAALPGLRTMFNAFHHFDPAEARVILASAAEADRPIAIVEFIERSPLFLLGIFFSPLLVLIVAPFFRPFRWQTLVLTYVIPVVPLVVFWDGLASWLRVYSLRELEELAASTAGSAYKWEVGRWGRRPLRVTYLTGCPLRTATDENP